MKKRLLCVLLAVVLLCLPGCKPDQTLEGTWTAQVDALQAVLPMLPKEVSMLPLGALPVTLELTLTGEGTFSCTVDRESIRMAVETLWQKAQRLLEGKESNSQGMVAALEDILGVAADQLKEGLQELLENADIEQKVTQAYDRSGTYTDDGKQLMLTDSEGNTFLSGKYLLLGEKLTVTAPFPGTAVLIFQKQN